MLKKVTSVMYWVSDLGESLKFYEAIGFRKQEHDDMHATVVLGDFSIYLVPPRKGDTEFEKDMMSSAKGEGAYLYVEADDVDMFYKELTDKGLRPSAEPRDWPWGNREFVIKDPNGYKLCFWQPSKHPFPSM